jgi:predicted amidohydrolase
MKRSPRVRVALASPPAGQLGSLERWYEWVARAVRGAAAESDLVVLPAHIGTAALAAATGIRTWDALRAAARAQPDLPAKLRLALCGLAQHYRVHLLAGTALVWSPTGLRHEAWLIGARGEVIGEQAQTHLTREESTLGLVRGDDLRVFSTAVGEVGILVHTDLWIPEAFRILALRGATLVLAPVAVPAPYLEVHQMRGLWQQAQQNQVFGVECGLHGTLLGTTYASRPAVCAPCEGTPGESGWWTRADPGVALVRSELDYGQLQEAIARFDVFAQFNLALYERYLPAVYGSSAASRTPDEPSPTPGSVSSVHVEGPAGRPYGSGRALGGPWVTRLRQELFRALLWWSSRPERVRSVVRRQRLPRAPERGSGMLRAAAIQMEVALCARPETFVLRIAQLLRRAVEEGAQLIVFPEDTGAALLGMLPGLRETSAARTLDETVRDMAGSGARAADVLGFVGPYVERIVTAAFSELARLTRTHIVAGSALVPQDGRVFNTAFFFGPDGQEIGRHRKCHLLAMEAAWGLATGEALAVYPTPLGAVALPICMDATYFETYRILALEGAEIVCVPTADPQPYNFWKARRGPWPRTQESQVYSVHACLVGHVFGMPLTGRSALFAPIECTPNGSGVIAEAHTPDGEEVVVGALDLEALRELRRRAPFTDALRPDLYGRVFPALYREWAERNPRGHGVWSAGAQGVTTDRSPPAHRTL